jgi:regulator of sirC expression with transglutaminase-like and TPR domain
MKAVNRRPYNTENEMRELVSKLEEKISDKLKENNKNEKIMRSRRKFQIR